MDKDEDDRGLLMRRGDKSLPPIVQRKPAAERDVSAEVVCYTRPLMGWNRIEMHVHIRNQAATVLFVVALCPTFSHGGSI